jgi:adenosylcobinamide-phosphate synthase
VLYRLSSQLQQKWGLRDERYGEPFGQFAAQIQQIIDWIPIRLTAISFATMGDFEDALYCWRAQAQSWGNVAYGILLASAAGAIGVRLGEPLHQDHTVKFRPELGLGEEADANTLKSAVGLIWRVVLFWLFIVFLLSFVSWIN